MDPGLRERPCAHLAADAAGDRRSQLRYGAGGGVLPIIRAMTSPGRAGGAVVTFEHVTKRYAPPGTPPAVEDLSLTIPAGEICVLVGPSGCGQTPPLRLINH